MSRPDRYLSLRWRVIVPLFILILIAAMVAAYVLPRASAAPMTAAAQQLTNLVFASLAAFVVILTFIFVNWTLQRINAITRVAQALINGNLNARTGMKPTSEIGRLGHALDLYAEHVQERQDLLRAELRRHRREINQLTAVLETLPEGVIVQDNQGSVVFTNDHAKKLLGTQSFAQEGEFKSLTEVVTAALGPAIAPGIYALGDPRRVERDGKMLNAQAAALLSATNERVGTVIVLRDITDDVRRERARDVLISRLSQEVEQPLSDKARLLANPAVATTDAMNRFAREMSRHAIALQKLVVEMRELTADLETRPFTRLQRPLPLDTLVWAVANEWRQVAQAENLRLEVQIERQGLYVLGDERRLRWAIGNLVDNAVKYTLPGGTISLEIKGEDDGMARLRIRDNGVGIFAEEQANVFTRFYRGTPTAPDGRVIHVPGTGQGLAVARQIIEAHGGRIHIKSAPSVGTAVYFTLPVTSPVSIELPYITGHDMEGETVRLQPSMSSAIQPDPLD